MSPLNPPDIARGRKGRAIAGAGEPATVLPSGAPLPPEPRSTAAPAPRTPAQRVGRVVLAAALVLLGLWILQGFLVALAWAAIFAIAIWPLYCRLVRVLPEGSDRVLAPLLATLLIGVGFIVPLAFVALAAAQEIQSVVELIIAARRTGVPVPYWVPNLPIAGHWASDWWRTNLSDPHMAKVMLGRVETRVLADSARELGGEILHRLTLFVFTLLTLFFLLRNSITLSSQLLGLSDRLLGGRGERIARHMISAVHGTVNGLVLVGLAEGLILGAVYFAVGLPQPVLFGALTGVLAVIPFGAPVIFGAAALFLISQGQMVAALVILGAGIFVLFVADQLVRPVLIGGAARLPFLWVLLGILGGLETFGILGLFLGPTVMAALMSLWREWTEGLAPPAAPALLGSGRPAGAPRPRKA